MPMEEGSKRIKATMQSLKQDARSTLSNITGSMPRPVMDTLKQRKTMILKQPLMRTIEERTKRQ